MLLFYFYKYKFPSANSKKYIFRSNLAYKKSDIFESQNMLLLPNTYHQVYPTFHILNILLQIYVTQIFKNSII
jgi:hypothetical protein